MPLAAEHKCKNVLELFHQQVERQPDELALIQTDGNGDPVLRLTYRELAAWSQQIAASLSSNKIEFGHSVAIEARHSAATIATMLACTRIGAVFVPLDFTYPRERLEFILADTEATLVLCVSDTNICNVPTSIPKIQIETFRESTEGRGITSDYSVASVVSTNDSLYIMYTSGSTGRPKGVEVGHSGVIRLVDPANSYISFNEQTNFLQLSPLTFDASILEIWGPLLNGGTCVIYDFKHLPNPEVISRVIQQHGVTSLWLTASYFNWVIDNKTLSPNLQLREILTGGEPLSLPHVRKAQELLPQVQLVNGYGPTETTTFACCYQIPNPIPVEWTDIPIGYAIQNTQLFVVDSELTPIKPGTQGELLIAGGGLAKKYRNLPEQTKEKFIELKLKNKNVRAYRTGDIVRADEDGLIHYLGRVDDQVKIAGHRIELGEINAQLLAIKNIKSAHAQVELNAFGDKVLIAYIVTTDDAKIEDLKSELAKHVPGYMVPNELRLLDELPLNQNGKVDRDGFLRAIKPQSGATQSGEGWEMTLQGLWREVLGVTDVREQDNFFDQGGNSLLYMRMVTLARSKLPMKLTAVDIFEAPTFYGLKRLLAERLADRQTKSAIQVENRDAEPLEVADREIAVIGMSGRFPGARDVDSFWQNLLDGKESITRFEFSELEPLAQSEAQENIDYVYARGIVDEHDCFDASFFGISHLEAEISDPQQRLFLEETWKALEHAGYYPTDDLRIGVFAGSGHNGYYLNHVIPKYGVNGPLGSLPTQFVNDKDYIATRAAFKLNLKGPCLSINTACSTSLVTTVEAVKSLRAGECDIALSGGVSLQTPMRGGYVYLDGGMLSKDGATRPFDKDSSGTTFNSGVAVVVLKRLRDAIRDGDTVYATIRGVGLNNDGAGKASFTAPSVLGQAEVVKAAIRDAGCSPDEICYVETHGTATPLGDPIEVEALARAFSELSSDKKNRSAPCWIGSVKSNVGHLVSAAGATGLIKTALSLKNRKIPSTLHYHAPNPHIDFDQTPFRVCAQSQELSAKKNAQLLAGVSSFGVGGTNAHVVVAAPPVLPERTLDLRPQLVPVSAKDQEVAANYLTAIGGVLSDLGAGQLADAAYTAQQSRSHLSYRSFTVVTARDQSITASVKQVPDKTPDVVFMFPGQGSQILNMGRQLYFNQPVFRQTFDECADLFEPLIGLDLRDLIFTDPRNDEHKALMAETRYTQPAIFANEYALAQLWIALGVIPAALVGHSIGEYSAAAVAGMFCLNDAVTLVAERGRLMFSMAPGSMLAVMADEQTTQQFLQETCEISVINGPRATVVSGADASLATMIKALEAAEIKSQLLETSHAFHSADMQPAADAFLQLLSEISINPPAIPIISTMSGSKQHDMTSAGYWAEQIRQPVRFYDAVTSLEAQDIVLLEVGPGRSLLNNTRSIKHPRVCSGVDGSEKEYENWLNAVGTLWQEGVTPDWSALHAGHQPRRIPLPTYPFKRNRYWIPATNSNSLQKTQLDPPLNPFPAPFVTDAKEAAIASIGNCMSIKEQVADSLKSLFADLSGEDFSGVGGDASFLDLGMDSLLLTQIALKIKNQYKVDIPFRRMMQDLDNFDLLSQFLAENTDASNLPQTTIQVASSPNQDAPAASVAGMSENISPSAFYSSGGLNMHALIAQQLQLINQQLMLMSQGATTQSTIGLASAQPPSPAVVAPGRENKTAFGAQTRINLDNKHTKTFTAEQMAEINAVMLEYIEKTKSSKAYAQQHRNVLADPRTNSGFSPELKEIVYPIVVNRSKGSRFWDLDGNEYIDTLCGYGSNFLGYSPDFVIEAMKVQLDQGIEIGPQHPLAGELADLLAQTIPLERFAFCNTGSEAVLGAIRMARTASGRKTIVMFNGAYHGIVDEVIVRPGPDRKGRPAAAGIMAEAASNMLILDYGDPESLSIIRDKADDIAGVLIEPVQSRNPALQPREFLRDLRKLTKEHEIAFIMDEVITGFRVGLGGAQEHFDVKADLATYGKVIGGGISIGIIGGSRKYMDTLDGGAWKYGDDSAPEVGVTYFAGTFVRHPLALASAMAVLKFLREQGNQLQQAVSQKAQDFARDMNLIFKYNDLPMEIGQFSSLMYLKLKEEVPYVDVMFADMRRQGVHIYQGRPMFFTTAHTDADIETIKRVFLSSIERMQSIGVLKSTPSSMKAELN